MLPHAESPVTDGLMRDARRRRTFAIISHPDVGKTTLTEKVLWYAGALHMAGVVHVRKHRPDRTLMTECRPRPGGQDPIDCSR